jgi:hypothetical protein
MDAVIPCRLRRSGSFKRAGIVAHASKNLFPLQADIWRSAMHLQIATHVRLNACTKDREFGNILKTEIFTFLNRNGI